MARDHVNITLEPRVCGLLGLNGEEKSTVMNIVTDNLKPSSEQALYNEVPIHKLGIKYLNYLDYMPQQQCLYKEFSAEEFLWYMATLKDVKRSDSKLVNLFDI